MHRDKWLTFVTSLWDNNCVLPSRNRVKRVVTPCANNKYEIIIFSNTNSLRAFEGAEAIDDIF